MYCLHCDYSLRDLESRACPECGRTFDPSDEATFAPALAGSRRRAVDRALMIFSVGGIGLGGLLAPAVWTLGAPALHTGIALAAARRAPSAGLILSLAAALIAIVVGSVLEFNAAPHFMGPYKAHLAFALVLFVPPVVTATVAVGIVVRWRVWGMEAWGFPLFTSYLAGLAAFFPALEVSSSLGGY